MAEMNQEIGRRGGLQGDANVAKVRKLIEDICKVAGATVAIEQRTGDEKDKHAASQHLQVTYTGEKPMPYANWFKLVDTIDEALESTSSDLIDWESSELSDEKEQERMASWKIAAPASE